jgi:DNA-directed RNA polymerase specialized sigma24 family protein
MVPFLATSATHQDVLSTVPWVDLLSMATNGDPAAEQLFFDRLRQRMVRSARHVLRRRDIEDLVQDVLLVVHLKYRDLLADSRLQDQAGFDRWWRRILYHRIGNEIRRWRFESEHRLPAERLLTVPSVDAPDHLYEASELRHLFLRALRRLNTAQRSFLREGVYSRHPLAGSRRHRNATYAKVYRARKALRQALRLEGSF